MGHIEDGVVMSVAVCFWILFSGCTTQRHGVYCEVDEESKIERIAGILPEIPIPCEVVEVLEPSVGTLGESSTMDAAGVDDPEVDDVPLIYLLPANHDFGTVKRGEELKLTLEVKRPEGTPLRLGRVLTSCTCVTASAPKRVFSPDETAQIFITIIPDNQVGWHEYTVTAEVLDKKWTTVVTSMEFNLQ